MLSRRGSFLGLSGEVRRGLEAFIFLARVQRLDSRRVIASDSISAAASQPFATTAPRLQHSGTMERNSRYRRSSKHAIHPRHPLTDQWEVRRAVRAERAKFSVQGREDQ